MRSLCFCALLLTASNAPAAPLVVEQSRIAFTGSQMNVPVEGRFTAFSGEIVFKPEQLAASSARLKVEAASIDIGLDDGNATLKQPDWFDAEAFPAIEFASRSFKDLGGGRYAIEGELRLKGASLPLRVEAAIAKTPQGLWRAEATIPLKRLALKLGVGEWADTSMVADEVVVNALLVAKAES
ncbi:MAG: YceI family protein [Gammaproteobacteria bacterium]|nr:YceI family protein [Gammaproteobacteria bacterium]